MKLSVFFMIIGCLQLSAAGLSQTVTIKVENTPLEKVFEMVEQQTGYMFFYEKKLVQQTKRVTIAVKESPINQFLHQLLSDCQLEFSIRNTTVTINRREILNPKLLSLNGQSVEGEKSQITVTGVVTGINKLPLQGATVRNLTSEAYTLTDKQGKFSIKADKGNTLLISYVNYQSVNWRVTGPEAVINLELNDNKLQDVEVVISTGYQKFKPEEMVGSVSVVTQAMLQKQVGSNILQRLEGLAPGFQFVNKNTPSKAKGNPESVLGINIRGWNTINGPTDPLIIVDDFPYYGDINNINPNDVEQVLILKDASSAGVWGARSANGVIVINTKKGKIGQRTNISFTSILDWEEKPKLGKLPLLPTSSYVDLELEILKNSVPSNLNSPFTTSEVGQVVIDRLKNLISAEDSTAIIDELKSRDSRREWDKYFYVPGLKQQHTLSLTGGSLKMTWSARAGYMRTRDNTRGSTEKIDFAIKNKYNISTKLEAEIGIDYVSFSRKSGTPGFNDSKIAGGSIGSVILRPYMKFADEAGNPIGVSSFSKAVLDTLGSGLLLDYYNYPLTNWQHDYEKSKQKTYLLTGKLSYKPLPGLSLRLMVQTMQQSEEQTNVYDKESIYTRELINSFSIINKGNNTITRQLPVGDIRKMVTNGLNSYIAEAVVEYTARLGNHHDLTLITEIDVNSKIRNTNGEYLIGYSESPLYHSVVDLYSTFQTLPFSNGSSLYNALGIDGLVRKRKTENRFIGATASLHYTYKKKYIFYSLVRREGFNNLGLSTNDRWKPFWSFGGRWNIHKEDFFKLPWMNELSINSSIGVTGLVDVSRSSRTIGNVNSSSSLTPFPFISIASPPNPHLRWEKQQQYSVSIAAGFFKGRISATIEAYIKRARDLYGNIIADFTQAPGAQRTANTSSMNVHGWDLQLVTRNLTGKFEWQTTINCGRTISKVIDYLSLQPTGTNFIYFSAGNDQGLQSFNTIFPGQELHAVRAIRSAGLNDKGQIQFLVDGKPTTDINAVAKDIELNGASANSLVYYGSSSPKASGGFINQFYWKGFGLYVGMSFDFGFYFIRSTALPGISSWHKDWDLRWRKPGDELHTTVPAVNLTNGGQGSEFFVYRVLSDLVKKGDNIRINTIQLDYVVPVKRKLTGLQSLRIAFNVSGLGIIWRANKEGLDPRFENSYMIYNRENKTWSFSVYANF